jgi:hypothetical protein
MDSPAPKIIGCNLLALLVMAGALRLWNQGTAGGMGFAIMMVVVIVAQAFINSLFGIFADDRPVRQAHWISFLLVLLIGFGTCAGGLTSY